MSDQDSPQHKRIWQRMLSGRRLNLAEPSPLDIEIEDIARGLARTNRWSGQTSGNYGLSVAQHSVLVVEQLVLLSPKASNTLRLAALLHDAAEYVIGDLISPFKHSIGGAYLNVEESLQAAIHQRFGLPYPLEDSQKQMIKRADRHIAWLEATQLAGFTISEASRFIARKPTRLVHQELIALSPQQAEDTMLECFHHLSQSR